MFTFETGEKNTKGNIRDLAWESSEQPAASD